MAESSAAWKTQIDKSFRRCAALSESPGSAPQTGTTALRNSGYSSANRHAPTPPADWPASEMRSGSTAYADATRVASDRTRSSRGRDQPGRMVASQPCGMTTTKPSSSANDAFA